MSETVLDLLAYHKEHHTMNILWQLLQLVEELQGDELFLFRKVFGYNFFFNQRMTTMPIGKNGRIKSDKMVLVAAKASKTKATKPRN